MNSFSVDQKTLFSILSWMQPICTKRTTLDVTSCILFHIGHREMVLKSTDLEISLQTTCLLDDSNNSELPQFLVSGKRIYDVVKELEGTIRFTLQNNQLIIKSGGVDVALNIKDVEGFPSFPERIENIMQLNANFVLTMLDKVAFLIPQNNANPALNGLLMEVGSEGLAMTTTDGHSLAQIRSHESSLSDAKKWLIPRRAIFELKKILESVDQQPIFLGMCNNQLVFSGQTFNFFSKLLASQFPDYAPILQKQDFSPAFVDRHQFIKTLRRSACLLSGSFIATQFSFDVSNMLVSMHNKEVGNLKEELPINGFQGARLDIRFYAPYLLNGLQAFTEDQLTFYLKMSTRPIIFESKSEEYQMTYLVMPVSPTATA